MEEKFLEKKRILLDASAQFCRLLGDESSKERIITILDDFLKSSMNEKKIITLSVVYAQFLDILVKDIIWLRDLVKEHFLGQMKFTLSLNELKEPAGKADTPGLMAEERKNLRRRLVLLCDALESKYPCGKPVETKRVLRFLDSYARDLMLRDFFRVRVNGETYKIEEIHPEIDCTAEEPLQVECNLDEITPCLFGIFRDFSEDGGHHRCLSKDASVTNCKSESGRCIKVIDYLNRNSDFKKLVAEIKHHKQPFRKEFMDEKKQWINAMKALTDDCSNFNGDKCIECFFDMLIALQCPDDAFILTRNEGFQELKKVMGKPDFFSDF